MINCNVVVMIIGGNWNLSLIEYMRLEFGVFGIRRRLGDVPGIQHQWISLPGGRRIPMYLWRKLILYIN